MFELFQGTAELVGTRGGFGATPYAVEAGDDIIDFLSGHQTAYALQVAIAAANEEDLLDDVVVVDCYVDHLRASARGLIKGMFHITVMF